MSESFWVFGYGSLLWRPGFEYVEKRVATLHGFHRSFCMTSLHYRGTEETPGLVLALDPAEGAICQGLGFLVAAEIADETLEYLRERELISYAYFEQNNKIEFNDGDSAEALCYIIDRGHEQYAGALELDRQADIIARASGSAGPNSEYLFNTFSHMQELGISDPDMEHLVKLVKERL